ncbi:hypothetical protein [Paenibacillus pseudetheri]|uniref:Uncharacterized protein n=1 Tax=Paenibacillus pseudetheri TaxID=2897682 RepID=A0ABN8FJE3_9BACL|nr:hypothetical protein [Paenibacillus pseudetheri]CAH1057287.1 hypothetical protein PAECIP111894_03445 [Paenibacillus pseudetheri]
MTEIQIAAVGDLMVKRYIISDAKQTNGTYSFTPLFAKVAGIILKLTIKKDNSGSTSITNIDYIPTCVDRRITNGGRQISEVIPIRDALKSTDLKTERRTLLNRMLKHTTNILKRQ